MNITVRNIPDDVISKIRTLSQIERRSLNNEILMILEQGLKEKLNRPLDAKQHITKELQIGIWRSLAGRWEDDRSTHQIIKDIYENRTLGRTIDL